jgi:hypothetical protein
MLDQDGNVGGIFGYADTCGFHVLTLSPCQNGFRNAALRVFVEAMKARKQYECLRPQ